MIAAGTACHGQARPGAGAMPARGGRWNRTGQEIAVEQASVAATNAIPASDSGERVQRQYWPNQAPIVPCAAASTA